MDKKRNDRIATIVSIGLLATIWLISGLTRYFSSGEVDTGTGYSTLSYNVTVDVRKDYSYVVVEKIKVNFTDPKHGIVRNIPFGKGYKIKDVSVDGDKYKIKNLYKANQMQIKIGDKKKTVTGVKDYTIIYTLANYERKNNPNDIYVDVLPSEWATDIKSASVSVYLPQHFPYSGMKGYSGPHKSTYNMYGTWTYDKNQNIIEYSVQNLPANNGATLLVDTPKGYWYKAPSKYWVNYATVIVAILGVIILIVLRVLNEKDHPIVAPVTFEPPKGVPPGEIGYLVDEAVNKRDITSMFFYLASKGYISIEEYKKGKYQFESLRIPDVYDEPPITVTFYKTIFGSTKTGTLGKVVSLEEASKRIGKECELIRKVITEEYTDNKSIFSKKSQKNQEIADIISCIIGGVLIALSMYREFYLPGWRILIFVYGGSVILAAFWRVPVKRMCREYHFHRTRSGPWSVTSFAFWGIIYLAISSFMLLFLYKIAGGEMTLYALAAIAVYALAVPLILLGFLKRTKDSAKLYGEIIGFKEFIATAEVDRINALAEENPSYFYDVLPYAYVFGLTDTWAKKFEPKNLAGHIGYSALVGDVYDFINMDIMIHHVQSSAFSRVSSALYADVSGGLSSGGGGSVGGGSGGGGGGGW